MLQVIGAWDAFDRVGWPEGKLFMAQAICFVATAPKSNASYMAFSAALDLAWIAPAIVLQSLVASLSVSLLSLAVSSLSRSARVAGLGFFGLFAGLEMARVVLRAAFDQGWAALLSLQANIRAIGNAIFGVVPRRFEAVPHYEAALVLIVVWAGCLLLLRSRVRAVEIVR